MTSTVYESNIYAQRMDCFPHLIEMMRILRHTYYQLHFTAEISSFLSISKLTKICMYLRPLWLPCSGPKSNTLAMSSAKQKQVPLVTNNAHCSPQQNFFKSFLLPRSEYYICIESKLNMGNFIQMCYI